LNKLEYAIGLILDNDDTLWYYENGIKYLVIEINNKKIFCYNPNGETYLNVKDTYTIEENYYQGRLTSYILKKRIPKKIRRLR